METLTVTIKNISILNEIQKACADNRPLTPEQQTALSNFLARLPLATKLLSEKTGIGKAFPIVLFDVGDMHPELAKWVEVFKNMPGSPTAEIIERSSPLLEANVIIRVSFSPSLFYYEMEKKLELHLKTDSTASFALITMEDAELFPSLYAFNGSWQEAYLMVVKAMLRGWPQEKFPSELNLFLPKKS